MELKKIKLKKKINKDQIIQLDLEMKKQKLYQKTKICQKNIF